MLNKQNLWFLTLFSLVMILGVYYVTMPNELMIASKNSEKKVAVKDTPKVEKTTSLEAMRVSKEEERTEEVTALEEKLTNDKTTTEEKNNAYEKLKSLNAMQGKEEKLEKILKEKLNLDCFVKTDEVQNCEIVCISTKHDNLLANKIMRTVQVEYSDKLNTTVKFKKK